MTPFIREIAALSGGNVWLVGGFLRDALLGRPTADVDVVVDGDAGALAKRFARAPGRSFFPLDKERGTYRVSLSANLFRPPKLSTDHKELPSSLGRRCPEGADEGCAIFSLGNRIPHPALSQEERENRFRGLKRHLPSPQENVHFDFARLQGPTLEADLRRRDFTVNALALPASLWGTARWRANLLDPTGGVPDLAARRLRRVSPHAFREDPLRLLRAYRFSAELGFGLTPETVKDIRLHRRKLARSAPERVREELLRLLSTPRAAATLADMDRAGLLVVLFPELEPMRRTGRAYYGTGGVLAHSLAAVGSLEKLLEELPVQFPSFHGALSKHLYLWRTVLEPSLSQ
jgi:tRNA nucleotidyltransferase/poly(A) polymerase